MKYSNGGVLDESLPDMSIYIDDISIDYDELKDWLGNKVGWYRMFQKPLPNAREEKKELKNYIKVLEKVIEYAQIGGLPPDLERLFFETAYKANMNITEIERSILSPSYRALAIAKSVQAKLEKQAIPKGAPKKSDRNRLFFELIEKLQPYCQSEAIARQKAADILKACGIEVTRSFDPNNAERSIRRISKKQRTTK